MSMNLHTKLSTLEIIEKKVAKTELKSPKFKKKYEKLNKIDKIEKVAKIHNNRIKFLKLTK